MWDLYNEPDNPNFGSYFYKNAAGKSSQAYRLLRLVYKWARDINPSQPLTTAIWGWNYSSKVNTFSLGCSDIITFHSYRNAKNLREQILTLQHEGRPIVCTEYMARTVSTIKDCMTAMHSLNVGCLNWGLVSGKTQTIFPWISWVRPWRTWKLRGKYEPEIWFHDLLRRDGSPYVPAEINLIKKLTGIISGPT